MENKKENLHTGHRQRLKEKFLSYGEEVLSDHEFLELLLFFSIPYKNTNDIAHELLNEYGSFSQLIETRYDVLRKSKIHDMKDNSACLLKVVHAAVSRYIREKNDISKLQITPENIDVYARNLFLGHSNEASYALLLDSNCYVKKVKQISAGTMIATPMYPRELIKFATSQEEPYLIIMHNHPNGIAYPSEDDLKVTRTIVNALNYVDVRLVDHVIVGDDRVYSMARDSDFFNK